MYNGRYSIKQPTRDNIMFYTVKELAAKYHIESVTEFSDHITEKGFTKENPFGNDATDGSDRIIPATGARAAVMSYVQRNSNLPTARDVSELKEQAADALITYIATVNVINSYDFNVDMMLEEQDHEEYITSASDFCTGEVGAFETTVTDLIDNDVLKRLPGVQREIAKKISGEISTTE